MRVITPQNPSLFWGNFLIFKTDSAICSPSEIQEIWKECFHAYPMVRHQAFIWDRLLPNDVALSAFGAAGYELYLTSILKAPKTLLCRDWDVRLLTRKHELNAALDLDMVVNYQGNQNGVRNVFEKKYCNYLTSIQNEQARWFGIYQGDLLIGSAGVLLENDSAVIVDVQTHENNRMQGICRTLISKILDFAGARSVYIEADAHSLASKIYEKFGFKDLGNEVTVFKSE